MPDKESLGGPINCEPPFVEGLRAAGVEVDEEVYVYGESTAPTGFRDRARRVIRAARRLRRRTRENRYDIIHLNTSIDEKCVIRDLVTLAFLRSSGVPVYLKMHGSIAPFLETKSRFWRFLQIRLFAPAAGIGVLSSEERENFIAAGCPAEKLSAAKLVMNNAVFRQKPDFRRKHGIGPYTPILLFSARFIPTKGLLDVIAACSELKKKGRDFVLFCLGDGPVRHEAEQLVSDMRLDANVRFFGYISEEETNVFHSNSTVFVFPTYHDEGFPIVILKSIAAGLPIVTTRIRGAADHLADPENCLWTEPRSPYDIALKLERLLDDRDLRTAMSLNNLKLAEHFTPAHVAAEYIRLYQDIIDKQKSR